MRCNQCEALMINGVFCNETGCPNTNARYGAETGEWIKQRKCFECGCTVDADDPCCNAEPEPEPERNSELTTQDMESLEKLIDRVGNAKLADAVARIAHEKAEHVQSNWQDKKLARVWTRVARRFEKQIPGLDLADEILGFRR